MSRHGGEDGRWRVSYFHDLTDGCGYEADVCRGAYRIFAMCVRE